MTDTVQTETRRFDAEVHQLLKLMIQSLYSSREIFLRELISNASDASDKLRFQALTDESLKGLDCDLNIDIEFDTEAGTLTVCDRGIGMSHDEVIENLGTIARSGTREFLEKLSGDEKKDARLIGQFGVGFYSAFIVADEVTVLTRRAGDDPESGVRWHSTGEGEYDLAPETRSEHGTKVILQLREDHRDLLDAFAIRGIVNRYSNHVAFPIRLLEGDEPSVLNDTQALWKRARKDLSDDDYKRFYTGLSGDPEAPLAWAHHHVEGAQEYSLLLYLPSSAPDELLYGRDERRGLKLYIQRVFIMDAAEQLLPRYLRFMCGLVDAEDLPLNVSREILQDSPLLAKIRQAVIKRSLDLLEKLAAEGGEQWRQFWTAFGSVLKEGVIEDPDNRERLTALLRFASTRSGENEQSVSLADYVARMSEGQEAIWYLTAESPKVAAASPHLEAFRKRDIEVLLLSDRVDEWLVGQLHEFEGKPLKSVARGKLDLDGDEAGPSDEAKALAGRIKQALGKRVGNVQPGQRLTDSPSCVVMDEQALPLHMQRLLKQAGQEMPETAPDLEINVKHPLLERMVAIEDGARFNDLAGLLLDQALLAEGCELADPAGFVKRVNALLVKALV